MDQKQNDPRANQRQTNIGAETEIRELSLNDLDHVAGGTKPHGGSAPMQYLTVTLTEVVITSVAK